MYLASILTWPPPRQQRTQDAHKRIIPKVGYILLLRFLIVGIVRPHVLFLVSRNRLASVDFSSPKSEIALYSFHRKPPVPPIPPPIPRWVSCVEPLAEALLTCLYLGHQYAKRETARSFDSGYLTYLIPSPSRAGMLAGFLNTTGSSPRKGKQPREIRIGDVIALNM